MSPKIVLDFLILSRKPPLKRIHVKTRRGFELLEKRRILIDQHQ